MFGFGILSTICVLHCLTTKSGLILQGCHAQIRHLRDIFIKEILDLPNKMAAKHVRRAEHAGQKMDLLTVIFRTVTNMTLWTVIFCPVGRKMAIFCPDHGDSPTLRLLAKSAMLYNNDHSYLGGRVEMGDSSIARPIYLNDRGWEICINWDDYDP